MPPEDAEHLLSSDQLDEVNVAVRQDDLLASAASRRRQLRHNSSQDSFGGLHGRSSTAKIARELKYFFMNPCQKYKAKNRKPFKLFIQIMKIAIVTAQLICYGTLNQDFTAFKSSNRNVLERSLYQYSKNDSKISKKENFYGFVNHIRESYVKMPNETTGNFQIERMNEDNVCNNSVKVELCVTQFAKLNNGEKNSYDLNTSIRSCHVLKEWTGFDEVGKVIPLCNGTNLEIDFIGLIKVEIKFNYQTVWLGTGTNHFHGKCFEMTSMMKMDNFAQSGLLVELFSCEFHLIKCHGNDDDIKYTAQDLGMLVLDFIIIFFCFSSTILCSRSIYRANRLKNSFQKYYHRKHNKNLDFWDKFEFINLWHFLIILSDVTTIIGSIIKVQTINYAKLGEVVDLNSCSIFLAIGCLCLWTGVLRYVGYFHQYNKLVLTMKFALPHVLRFMVCASILYFGFLFSGWIVLGPHHHKFRSLVVTSEALFSLINGDDMYMTYEEMGQENRAAWMFSQIYLYVFISMFIYIVLSVFIAVIDDAYETIKEWQEEGRLPRSKVEHELEELCITSKDNFDDYLHSDTYCFFCCYHNNDPDIDSSSEGDSFCPISHNNNSINFDVGDDVITPELVSERRNNRSMTS